MSPGSEEPGDGVSDLSLSQRPEGVYYNHQSILLPDLNKENHRSKKPVAGHVLTKDLCSAVNALFQCRTPSGTTDLIIYSSYTRRVKTMAWIYLILAGLFEIGWPLGLKMAQQEHSRISGILIALVCMTISGALLWLAQKNIPLGTSYAIWTGIGAAGTFLVGVWFYGDPSSLSRYLGILLIISGVVVLKLAH